MLAEDMTGYHNLLCLASVAQMEGFYYYPRVDHHTLAAHSDVVKDCKGVTSHELRIKYPFLHRMPSLWTRSYFAATAGNVSAETIQKYISDQKGM
jgi:DNA polymerase III alpha subunit